MHLAFAFGGLLVCNSKVTQFTEVRIIPLELVTVAEVTNIKTAVKKPLPEEPEDPEIPKEDPVEEPTEIAEIPPEIPKDIPTETEDGELLADTPPEEEPNVEPEAPVFDLGAMSRMVDQARQENPNANTQVALGSEIAERNIVGAGQQDGMTLNPTEYIQTKMAGCYKIDTGAKDYRKLRVEVRVHLSIDGEVQDIDILNNMQIIASPNNSWRAARDNVVFALNQCAPYDKLPQTQFSTWKTTKMNFQPADEG